jgi:hypothetical protein
MEEAVITCFKILFFFLFFFPRCSHTWELAPVSEHRADLLNFLTRVEAGSNTSTVTLRVVRGDEMGLKKAAP